jgi:hypothetical protein
MKIFGYYNISDRTKEIIETVAGVSLVDAVWFFSSRKKIDRAQFLKEYSCIYIKEVKYPDPVTQWSK